MRNAMIDTKCSLCGEYYTNEMEHNMHGCVEQLVIAYSQASATLCGIEYNLEEARRRRSIEEEYHSFAHLLNAERIGRNKIECQEP